MKKIWAVVADEAIARIFEWQEGGNDPAVIDEITDAAARADGADLRRDAQGRRSGSAAQSPGTPHRLRPSASVTASAGEDEKHLEAEGFARRTAQHLGQALQNGRFEELRIAAAPRFLGLLRKELDAGVAAVVRQELDKDLIHATNREIGERLFADRKRGTTPAA